MSLADIGRRNRKMDLNSSIDYLLGNKPLVKNKHTSLGAPKIEIVRYNIQLTDIEKTVLLVEAILVAWFILAKLKIAPIF